MSRLEHAIAIAASAHAGNLADDNEPYILHPLRVMLSLTQEDERIVGVLHDVVEKTGWTLENLRAEGFIDTIIQAVDAVTRRQDEEYLDFVRRTKTNPLGTRVKIADLQDNLRKVKEQQHAPDATEKLHKYEQALTMLSQAG
jgi:(p)ppGpp synthase/HD superfamily hydrolase